jgi:hypothetical protein
VEQHDWREGVRCTDLRRDVSRASGQTDHDRAHIFRVVQVAVPKLAILIAGSPNAAFYSQVAASAAALRALPWSRWEPTLHLYLGGEVDSTVLERWRPYLAEVDVSLVAPSRFAREGDWAQSDDVFNYAPRDADLLVAMDADVLPVAPFEEIVDVVAHDDVVAGTLAHAAFPGTSSPADDWHRVADGLVNGTLAFDYQYSLVRYPQARDNLIPFYVNFGVVLFSRKVFERLVPAFLSLRAVVGSRMRDDDFSAQVALALAIANTGVEAMPLPMRFNFPNDPLAERLYPEELVSVRAIHYLRTDRFDRHRVFASAEAFAQFLELPLEGANRLLQDAVRRLFGEAYPFAE